jgi:transposase-like protein
VLKNGKTGVNWRKLKAEYIAGGISQRKLAEKHGVNRNLLMRIAQREKWTEKRSKAEAKALERVEQKSAEEVADNAVTLQRIKAKLLARVETMIDNFPDTNAAEKRERIGNADYIYRLKDLAAVYSALEEKTYKASVDIEDLSPLAELLRDE